MRVDFLESKPLDLEMVDFLESKPLDLEMIDFLESKPLDSFFLIITDFGVTKITMVFIRL